MELREAVMSRRSVRKYRSEPVPREVLEDILETACWAPSADNRQPWYFVALTQEEDIALLRETMARVSEEIVPPLQEMFPRHPSVAREESAFLRRLGDAPVYVLVFLREERTFRDSMLESAAAAIQTLLLAANEKGLGSCWINAATELGYGSALRELFAPDKDEFVSLVTLGYPEITPKAPKRKPRRWVIR